MQVSLELYQDSGLDGESHLTAAIPGTCRELPDSEPLQVCELVRSDEDPDLASSPISRSNARMRWSGSRTFPRGEAVGNADHD
jgi:hypothetical protein